MVVLFLKYCNTTGSWLFMMTSSNENIFRVTGPLCGEFTGPRWIPRKASDAELWCFFDLRPNKRLSKQSWGWWFETLSCSLWRHCNDNLSAHRNCSFFQSTFCGFCERSSGNTSENSFQPRARHDMRPANETVLLCNDVSHWLGASLESTLW